MTLIDIDEREKWVKDTAREMGSKWASQHLAQSHESKKFVRWMASFDIASSTMDKMVKTAFYPVAPIVQGLWTPAQEEMTDVYTAALEKHIRVLAEHSPLNYEDIKSTLVKALDTMDIQDVYKGMEAEGGRRDIARPNIIETMEARRAWQNRWNETKEFTVAQKEQFIQIYHREAKYRERYICGPAHVEDGVNHALKPLYSALHVPLTAGATAPPSSTSIQTPSDISSLIDETSRSVQNTHEKERWIKDISLAFSRKWGNQHRKDAEESQNFMNDFGLRTQLSSLDIDTMPLPPPAWLVKASRGDIPFAEEIRQGYRACVTKHLNNVLDRTLLPDEQTIKQIKEVLERIEMIDIYQALSVGSNAQQDFATVTNSLKSRAELKQAYDKGVVCLQHLSELDETTKTEIKHRANLIVTTEHIDVALDHLLTPLMQEIVSPSLQDPEDASISPVSGESMLKSIKARRQMEEEIPPPTRPNRILI